MSHATITATNREGRRLEVEEDVKTLDYPRIGAVKRRMMGRHGPDCYTFVNIHEDEPEPFAMVGR